MHRVIINTSDNSPTVSIPEWNVSYHSRNAALQESRHVFIDAGLNYLLQQEPRQHLNILEMGFGTGLNAILTLLEAEKQHVEVLYTAVELFPLSPSELEQLNYHVLLGIEKQLFDHLHYSIWGQQVRISGFFSLQKLQISLLEFRTHQRFHLIFYDAFAPAAQPELWTTDIFINLFQLLHLNGVLVTYCVTGDVRRSMIAAGFAVEKLRGPIGKREMLRATRKI